MKDAELSELRNRIDSIDREISCLLAERFGIARSMAERKLKQKVRDSAREEEVLDGVSSGRGSYSENIRAVYEEIIKQSRAVQCI